VRRVFGAILIIVLALSLPLEASSPPSIYLTISPDGVVRGITLNGQEVPVILNGGIIWTRELTHSLEGANLLGGKGWRVLSKDRGFDVTLNPLEVTINSSKGRIILLSEPIEIDSEERYLLSLVVNSSNGFVGPSASPKLFMGVRWLDASKSLINVSRLMEVRGSAPVPKGFSVELKPPSAAEYAEVGLIVGGLSNTDPPMTVTLTFDSVEFREMPEEAEWQPVRLRTYQDNPLILKGEWRNISLNLALKYDELGLEAELSLDNELHVDRAIDVGIFLPLNATGWTWWYDLRRSETIGNEDLSNTVNSLVSGGYLPISLLPVASIDKDGRGLAVWIPLDSPVVYRLVYSPRSGLGSIFSLGLTEVGSRHSKARVRVGFYSVSGGLREATDLYQRDHSYWFKPHVEMRRREVKWPPAKYGVWFVQMHLQFKSQASMAAHLSDLGVYISQYILPWEFEPPTGYPSLEPPPSYWDVMGIIENISSSEKLNHVVIKSKAALNAASKDIRGYTIISKYLRGPSWRPDEWVPRIPLNTDPNLKGFNVWNYTFTILEAALNNTKQLGFPFDGVELDNFMGRSNNLDLREEAIDSCEFPLTYDPNEFVPAVHLSAPAVEYLRVLREWVSENLKGGLTGNFIAQGAATFGSIFLDAIPFECNPRGFNWGDENLSYRRILARWKPAMTVLTEVSLDPNDLTDKELMIEFINTSVFYGFLPTFKEEQMEVDGFHQVIGPKLASASEIVYRLHEASWEPQTYVKPSTPHVWVERYGSGHTIYLTVRNTLNRSVAANLSLNIDSLGWSGIYDASIVWGSGEISVGRENISIEIPAKGVLVLEIEGHTEIPPSKATSTFTLPTKPKETVTGPGPLPLIPLTISIVLAVLLAALYAYIWKRRKSKSLSLFL